MEWNGSKAFKGDLAIKEAKGSWARSQGFRAESHWDFSPGYSTRLLWRVDSRVWVL